MHNVEEERQRHVIHTQPTDLWKKKKKKKQFG
jgi:hypothetical protein